MPFFSRVVFSICALLVLCSSALAATQAQIDAARNKAIAWLINHQNGDGSWRTNSGLEVATTAETLQALANAGMKGFPYTAGVSWLSNTKVGSTDSLSRKVLALQKAGLNVNSYLDLLVNWKNTQATWGAYDHFDTSFPDTPLALSAIRAAAYTYPGQDTDLSTALSCGILFAQKSDGSWSYINAGASPPSSAVGSGILPTALNVLEINAIKTAKGWTSGYCGSTYYLQTAIDNGITWLLTKRNGADGGFGFNSTSTVLDTAIVYQVLTALRPNDAATGGALDYLITQQNTDGSWQGSAFLTSMVLKTWPSTVLADTDKDGIPDSVEAILGTNPNVPDSRWLARGNGQSVSGVTVSIVTANSIVNQGFNYALPNNGGTGPYVWMILSGSLPQGLSLNSVTGVINGLPTTAGTYDFIYNVTNASSQSSMIPATITVLPIVDQTWARGQSGVWSTLMPDVPKNSKVVTDSSGNIYVTGSGSFYDTGTSSFAQNYLTTKYDLDGNQLWSVQYDHGFQDEPVDIAVDNSGNVHVTGFSSNGTNDDYATVKYDANGNPLWGAAGARYDFLEDLAAGIALDDLGNVYVTGTSSNQTDNYDYATMKYDSNGIPQWAPNQARYNNGGDDKAVAIKTDSAGNIYVTGTSSNGQNDDFATLKYDPTGNALWSQAARYDYGGTDQAVAMAVDSIGNVYVTGVSSNGTKSGYATMKYDTNGVAQWPNNRARYDIGWYNRPVAIVVDTEGNIYVTGSSNIGLSGGIAQTEDYLTVKYDSNGNQLWVLRYDSGYIDIPSAIAIDGAGYIYVTGTTCYGSDSQGCKIQYTTLKYSPTGEQIWAANYVSAVLGGYVSAELGGINISTFDSIPPPGLAVDRNGNVTITLNDGRLAADFTTVRYAVPPAPGGLKVVDHPDDAGGVLDLTWIPYISPKITQQRIYRSTQFGGPYTLIATLTGNSANSYSNTQLVNGTTYYYAVRFFDGKNESANSNISSGVPRSNSALPTPSTLVANAASLTQISLTWTISSPSGVHHYEIERKFNNAQYTTFSTTTTTTYVDNNINGGVTYVYRVRAVDSAGNTSGYSNVDLATTLPFTNDPIVSFSENPSAPTIIKAVHFIELFKAVNAVRKTAGLAPFSWSTTDGQGNPILPPAQGNPIRAQHVIDLRNKLNEGLTALGLTALSYTDPTLTVGSTFVKKAHIQDLRQAVK
ncbi:MAG: SBBP repeat-containing protein [Nitrospirae bacterium]|nr:SBBP repeat-containing protein [Candidatus Manganitrophaceae bacterium]